MLPGHRTQFNNRFYTPVDDEAVSYTGAAAQGLTPAKIAKCEMVAIRFSAGDGVLRFSGGVAAVGAGIQVFAGDIEILSRFEAERLSGIRGGATNLDGWATYYQ